MPESTGRIRRTLTPSPRRILFGRDLDQQVDGEVPHIARIDAAHVLMLADQGLVAEEPARSLLRGIGRLAAQRFAPLRTRTARRGLFASCGRPNRHGGGPAPDNVRRGARRGLLRAADSFVSEGALA